jgi:hypothetical protein
VKKGQNERKSVRRLKPTVGCNAIKRRRSRFIIDRLLFVMRTKRIYCEVAAKAVYVGGTRFCEA